MMNVKVKLYDLPKYDAESKKIAEVEYKDVKSYEVKTISEEEISASYDMVDEYNEYLILTFANGETATFRNSHTDMFRM